MLATPAGKVLLGRGRRLLPIRRGVPRESNQFAPCRAALVLLPRYIERIDEQAKRLLLMPIIDAGPDCRFEISKACAELGNSVVRSSLGLGLQRAAGTLGEDVVVHDLPFSGDDLAARRRRMMTAASDATVPSPPAVAVITSTNRASSRSPAIPATAIAIDATAPSRVRRSAVRAERGMARELQNLQNAGR